MCIRDSFSSLNPRRTVKDLIGEPLLIHGIAKGKAMEERVAALMTEVGLDPNYMERYPHEFSGGQRQRIGIARALSPVSYTHLDVYKRQARNGPRGAECPPSVAARSSRHSMHGHRPKYPVAFCARGS